MQTNSCDQTTLRDLEKITTLRNKHIQTNNDEWTKKRNNGNFFLNEKKKNLLQSVEIIMTECGVAM
jgi:hypothetical protein